MPHSFFFIKKQLDRETCQAAFTDQNTLQKNILDRPKRFSLWRKGVSNLIFLYEKFLFNAAFTLGTRGQLPGHRYKIVLDSDNGH